jgi:hypothetical protein
MIPENARTFAIANLVDFVGITTSVSPDSWVYRGEASTSWVLRPKAGRDEFYRDFPNFERLGQMQNDDLRFFKKWRHEAIAYHRKLPKHYLECLAYAQHYGLATRLLDWSRNPLVALFFAVETHEKDDAVVYCHFVTSSPPLEPNEDISKLLGIRFYIPRPIDRRISAQQGVFTYHSHPREPFAASVGELRDVVLRNNEPQVEEVTPFSDLIAITIPALRKYGLKRQLRDVGVTRNSLFPDLEGLSSFINWEAREEVISLNRVRDIHRNLDNRDTSA